MERTIELFAQSIIEDNMIQVLGTGHSHMIGLEGFIRAGGLGNINAILDSTVLTSDGALRGSELEKLPGLADILWNDQKINKDDLVTEKKPESLDEKPVSIKEEGNTNEKLIAVKAPIIGTFYRKPAPDKDPFVEIGKVVKEGDVLCVIEAMKLFNEIESEVSGKIVEILVEDSSPVEFEQPLFLIDPV